MNRIQSLNGIWEYRIGKGKFIKKQVPFSELAVGHSECRRVFDLEGNADKFFLKFDGITYAAKVYLNDRFIGSMIAYCEYSFDITDCVKQKDNVLLVEIEDISPSFGPTAGWENFGGIIRDVSIEYKNSNYIEDVFAHYVLKDAYTSALLTVETKCVNRQNAVFEINLSYKGELVLTYTQSATVEPIAKKVTNVRLWNFDNPELYKLDVLLIENGETLDSYVCNIGFREITKDKHRFMVNGRPVFLKGVCKHEMYNDSGHCPTETQMQEDMLKIKETGCNFVRLVHYPHNKKILDIADKIGLFVSEEPGLWWSDTSNPEISNGSIEVLKRTIMRDRNHPCIAFWLCFNECNFTEQFLIDSARVCREYDPTRMVSGANCMSNEDTLKYYNICGFDFYTMHPYDQTFDRSRKSVEVLNDKPLIFTEWGGHYLYNNPKILLEFFDEMNKLYFNQNDDICLAGAFFWCWAEVNDFNRGRPACIDGNLSEGLLTQDRKPTMIYETFCEGIRKIGTQTEEDPFWFVLKNEVLLKGENLLKNCVGGNFAEFMSEIAKKESKAPFMRHRLLTKGPVLSDITALNNIPLIINDSTEIDVNCNFNTESIMIIGLTAINKGYPLSGEYGEDVAVLKISYLDGEEQEYVLKNGVDVTTAFTTNLSSRINPVAENTVKFAEFGYDKNFENYILNSMKIDVNSEKIIKKISIKSCNNGYGLLLYGLFGDS